jgi:O-acetylhomoserine (thiol)-lyase
MTASELRRKIAGEGRRLGLSLMGFAGVERWETGKPMPPKGYDSLSEGAFYPQTIWPWARTVISGAVQIFLPMLESTPSIVYSEAYNTTNRLLDEAAYRLAALLCGFGYKAFFYPRDGYGDISALVERPEASFSQVIAAKFAGLGTIGSNHCLLTPEFGPRVRLVTVITDAEIPSDSMREKDLCTGCGLCRANCPMRVFNLLPRKAADQHRFPEMDKYACAKYHQFLKKEYRYPCGVCTLVCPVGKDRRNYGAPQNAGSAGVIHVQDFGSGKASGFFKRRRDFIAANKSYRFETVQIHAGQEKPDPATGARAVPVYQTSSYVFPTSGSAAARFALTESGNIYTRIMNPTWDVFERRIAALEKGFAALATASGAAATTYAVQNIVKAGDHIVSDRRIYDGAYNLFANTFRDIGLDVTFVDGGDPVNFEKAIRENTKALFFETLGNPNSSIVDIEKIVVIAHGHGIPVIADNTFATPYLLTPIDWGVDVVVHSATKFIGGHGTSIGGVIVDAGRFDWAQNDRFPGLSKPNPSYHGVIFTDAVKNAAYIVKARTTLLRDTGAALSPFNAFLFLQGLETLSFRMERHISNAEKVVDFLKGHPQVERVNHPMLEDHPDHRLYKKYFPLGAGSVFTFQIRGDARDARFFTEKLSLFSLLANVADVKSLVIHPASTTHSRMTERELRESGIRPNTVRLSIGIEHIDDIIDDLETGFEAVKQRSKSRKE